MKAIPKPDIVEIVEAYGGTVLGGDRGGWRKATCPIHEDKSPSASVNSDECRFRCFVCDFSGDAVDLIMKVTSAGYPAAIKLAEKFLGDGDGAVREERGRSGLLPGAARRDVRGGSFTPPWTRL